MKKIVAIFGLAIVGLTTFAQGNFQFQGSGPRYVWDNWSSQAIKGDASNNVAFLWANSGTALISGVATSVATNAGTGFFTQSQLATAWTDILTDPNFHLATNAGTSTLVTAQAGTQGQYAYSGGGAFTVAGTSSGGGTVEIYVIGWSSLYADPFTAAANHSAVGWSSVFNYSYVAGPNPGPAGTPTTMAAAGLTPFGVASASVVVTPEPSTLALAALGGASLLLFRRRK